MRTIPWIAAAVILAPTLVAAPAKPLPATRGSAAAIQTKSAKPLVPSQVGSAKVKRAPWRYSFSRVDVYSAEDIARSGHGDLSSLFAGHITGAR